MTPREEQLLEKLERRLEKDETVVRQLEILVPQLSGTADRLEHEVARVAEEVRAIEEANIARNGTITRLKENQCVLTENVEAVRARISGLPCSEMATRIKELQKGNNANKEQWDRLLDLLLDLVKVAVGAGITYVVTRGIS
jgi:chromosome segregation ATPase